ncbi:MAG: DEAD/DEAH box helicase [Clostridia bacterium]
MILGEILYEDIEDNEYLQELYGDILFNYSSLLLKSNEYRDFNIEDALKFADILSKSNHTKNAEYHKIWAQEIASILKQLYPQKEIVDCYLNAILTNTGNFRGLSLMNYQLSGDGIFDKLYNNYSKLLLKIPSDETKYFFKSQKRIYNHLEDNAFSFSGPTSVGKSFIMRMFIKEKLLNNSNKNFAIIVPSKALINEISSNLINELKGLLVEKNYRIITSAGSIALEQQHNFIFILTPERLLYTLIKYEKMIIDYVFIDEAHKISEKDSRSTFYYKVIDMIIQRSNKTKFIFASPNIPNPEVFLKLIPESKPNFMTTSYSPVTQLKYLLDYKKNQSFIYNDKTQELTQIQNLLTLNDILHMFFNDKSSSIVYVNSRDKAIKSASEFATSLSAINDEDLKKLSKEIISTIHEDYCLAELVLKGVAFHVGYLPSNIRQQIEDLYKSKKIRIMFCTSTLVEGVNLPADNLFITTYKRGTSNFSSVDFKNLIGRVGRIEYNLYGHVFLVNIEKNTSQATYIDLIKQNVPDQQLSLVSELSVEDKNIVVKCLLDGNIEIPKEWIGTSNYATVRKFAIILLRDIMKNRKSVVKEYFSDVLSISQELTIKKLFNEKEGKPDDDINTSVDQTSALIRKIKEDLHYPKLNYNENASYQDILDFLIELSKIFKWGIYEDEDLNNNNKLRWYATLLSQWIAGSGLQFLTNSALQNAKEKVHSDNPKKIKINGKLEIYNDSPFHKNVVIGDTLQAIEKVILFSFANYFLKFSECYKKIHGVESFSNDWYEYVEYGTTNSLTIKLQRYGFSRETALYIRQNKNNFVTIDNEIIKLKLSILNNSKDSIKDEIKEVMYNAPELFIN